MKGEVESSQSEECEAAVVGAGPTGLAAALGLARRGLETILIAPRQSPDDGRTAALLQGSVDFLAELGAWNSLRPRAEALRKMEILDDTGRLFRAPTVRFEAAEIGLDAFGYNAPNVAITAALSEAAEREPRLRWLGSSLDRLVVEREGARLFAAGRQVVSRVLVAADGQRSLVRRAAGIEVDCWTYPQTALVLNVEHSRPHHGVSTELHRTVGPFTLVPLPGNSSSVVRVEAPPVAERLAALDEKVLAEEMEERAHGIRGRFAIASRRWLYPLQGLLARRLAAGPVALVGEAAHAFPPIAAQGLNLGLRDAAALIECLDQARRGGDWSAALSQYDRRRRADVVTRMAGVHILNRSLLGSLLPLQLGRAAGLAALKGVPALRRALMRGAVRPSL